MTSWSGGSSGQPPLYHNNKLYDDDLFSTHRNKLIYADLFFQVIFMGNLINFRKFIEDFQLFISNEL